MMTSIHSLPNEILLLIFSYYLETETQINFICNISHVCQAWREVCMDSSLWRTFDGTLPLCFLKKLCSKGCLKKTESFKFCNYGRSPSRRQLESIYKNLPCLKSINFSNVCWILSKNECKILIELITHCPDLCEIILKENRSKQPLCFDYKLLENFLQIRGSKLISLNFSNTCVSGLTQLFTTISSSCPNLEELRVCHIRNLSHGYFPIGRMQNGLKKLKILRLGTAVMMRNETVAPTDGFPNLRTFTRPSKRDFSMNDLRFTNILMKSPDLRVLDIRGCFFVTLSALYSLPAKNIEILYVSNTKIYEHCNFIDIIIKWGHSLVALDVSEMKENGINSLFGSLIAIGCLKKLEILHLDKTAVTLYTVKLIIQNCPKLHILNLESCRAIGNDHKRKYHGQTRIRELLHIDEGMDTTLQ